MSHCVTATMKPEFDLSHLKPRTRVTDPTLQPTCGYTTRDAEGRQTHCGKPATCEAFTGRRWLPLCSRHEDFHRQGKRNPNIRPI